MSCAALAARDVAQWGARVNEMERAALPQRIGTATADVVEDVPGLLRPSGRSGSKSDRAAAGDPAQLELVWQWRQLDTWVSELRRRWPWPASNCRPNPGRAAGGAETHRSTRLVAARRVATAWARESSGRANDRHSPRISRRLPVSAKPAASTPNGG